MGLDNPLHIAFLLVIMLLVFGAKRLPEIGRSVGEGMRGFKSSLEGTSTPSLSAAATVSEQGAPVARPQFESAASPSVSTPTPAARL
jgi:sec-independent protein translocase protein TatA